MNKKIFKIIPSLIFTSLIFSSGNFVSINETNEEDINITFMANGGKFSDDLSYKTKQYPYNTKWSSIKDNLIPKPTYSGYDLVKWTYDASKTSTNYVNDDDVFTKDTTIYAQWGANDPGTFASDSWATIINVANGYTKESTTYYGLEALKKAYENDIIEYGNTFVIKDINNEQEVINKTRTITLSGLGTFNVRVIGENHDLIEGETNKVASLTFEFMNMIVPGVAYNFNRSEGTYTDYTTSNLRTFLQNDIMMTMPEVLKTSMKSVTKKVTKGGSGTDKDTVITFNDKLFPLSSSELGITETGNATTKYEIAPLEGSVYPFFINNSSNSSSKIKNYVETYESGGKSVTKSIALPYWIRSHVNNDQYSTPTAYAMDTKFGNVYTETPTETLGVAPAFCIGASNAASDIRTITYTDSGATGTQTMIHSDKFVANGVDYIGTIKFLNKNTIYKVSDIAVKIGDEVLDPEEKLYYYDSDTGIFKLPNSTIENYTGNIEITANLIKDGFKVDSWERFLKNCSRGYDYLATTEWTDDSNDCGYKEIYEANGNTFVGLTRPINVKRYKFNSSDPDITDTYWVRIIGELADTYYIDTNLRSSLFTFEFTELLKNEEIDYDTVDNYDYEGSVLDKRLRSSEDTQNILSRFVDDSAKLNDSIVGVDKKIYYKADESTDPAIKTVNLKAFTPSTRELGYNITGIEDGEVYDYYNDGNLAKTIKYSDNNRTVSEKTPFRNRVYTQSNRNRYWSRTPNFDEEGYSSYIGGVYIFESSESDGYVTARVTDQYANYISIEKEDSWTTSIQALGYAPAFAIGNENPRFKVTASTRGYNFTGADKAIYGTPYSAEITSKSCEVNGTTYTPNKIPDKTQIKVTIGGVDVTDSVYTFTDTKGTINIPGEQVTGKVNIAINEVPLNLTWSELNTLATYDESESKQGEFVKEYIHDGGYLSFTDTEGTERSAKVIGYGHDPLKENVSKNAALTLEFTDVLSADKSSKWMTTFDSGNGEGCFDFTKSKAYQVTNSYFDVMPTDIQDMIKTVKKDYTKYDTSTYQSSFAQFDAKLFILSYNEYNSTVFQYGDMLVEQGYLLDNSKTYDYYQGSVKSSEDLCKKRAKSYMNFIRHTPTPQVGYMACFFFGTDELSKTAAPGLGFFTQRSPIAFTDKYALCPAFCI